MSENKPGSANLFVVLLVVAAAGVLAAFYGINEYATGTGAIVKSADRNADRFEVVFRDLVQARFRAMNLAADVMLQSRVTLDAFANNNRAALVSRMEPFFQDSLSAAHGVAQLNFWQPPAKVYYRAGDVKSFGQDLSAFRKSIVAANERRQRISAIETGLGGVIAIRAIVPVWVDDKYAGVVEYATGFDIPLERASSTTGLKWAVGLMKDVAERVERPVDNKVDAWKGNDVFYLYSDAGTGATVRGMDFNPRSAGYTLARQGGKTVFFKTFQVLNFSGVPTIVVATVLDVTDAFAEIMSSVLTKTAILFLVIAVLGSLGVMKFGKMRDGLTRALSKQKDELEERAAACDIAVARLREVDVIKRGFFTNLVAAITDPLQAILGQLQSVASTVEAVAAGREATPAAVQTLRERFSFGLSETRRLSRLANDYQELERFRQRLVQAEPTPVSLAELVGQAINEDLAIYRRLPQLSIAAAVPDTLPSGLADADLMRRAIVGLVGYAAQRGGQGKIILSGRVDETGALELSVTGSAFAVAGAPDEALLDEARQFLNRIAAAPTVAPNGAPLVGVVLSRIVIEYYGGTLEVAAGKDPGFVVRLPTMAVVKAA